MVKAVSTESYAMFFRVVPCALALFVVTGCANVQPSLPSGAKIDWNSGYVSAQFSTARAANFGLAIRSLDSERNYSVAVGHARLAPVALQNETVAIKLPPGRYVIDQLFAYTAWATEAIAGVSPGSVALATPFIVKAGTVTHLGGYELLEEGRPRAAGWAGGQIVSVPLFKVIARSHFALSYPNLAGQAFTCLPCSDGAGGGPPPFNPAWQ